MKIDVRFDAAQAIAQLSAYRSGVRDRAIVRALNRTATTVRASVSREIAAEMRPLKVGEVRKAIRIQRANKATLTALVQASGRRRIPITALNARQTRTGVAVRVGGRSYAITHAFINKYRGTRDAARIRAPSFSGQMLGAIDYRAKRSGQGGYWNKGSARRGTQRRFVRGDYPIAEIYAPGVPSVFVQERIFAGMRRVAIERFEKVIAQEVKFLESRGV